MRISGFVIALPLVLGLGLIPAFSSAENVRAEWLLALTQARQAENQARAFDFLVGRWEIHNRRLVKRLQGSNEWQEFEAQSVCDALPGRLGNQDEYRTDFWQGFVGLSLRFFDPKSGRWSIYWIDNHGSALQPPVIGAFAGGVGVFEGSDQYRGKPIRVRFTWSSVTTPHPRWEQAFSTDGGKTWETNWTMDFTRTEAATLSSR
jgi:hypothetical protein